MEFEEACAPSASCPIMSVVVLLMAGQLEDVSILIHTVYIYICVIKKETIYLWGHHVPTVIFGDWDIETQSKAK